ncbi:ABC transporter ATP-binding protein [Propylenella binzhouense]|uniref:ABC transporter ATP-binding protein n=1 Tax=Propylenella binzhouense TaxID=2555902 RepID=A0A964WSW3_9HYPH|nr:ABC transporter ATP-binding protein [Propylenella binzhouense]MYZ47388.1 ABC transporter ATP-binding protein [Propylenella binzhouense]
MTPPILKVENLRIAFGGVAAADGVELEIAAGEFMAIIGPNGAGKTTFLNLCTGYVKPATGSVLFEGRDITGLSPRAITRRGIARAFQIPQLFAGHSLLENVMLALAARHGIRQVLAPLDREAYRVEGRALLELVGLETAAGQPVSELPEGMRKLADIALALALKPRLLLMDEPTSGVSAQEKYALMGTLMQVLKTEGITALFVEHDMEIVRTYAGRVLVWDSGKVLASGAPEAVLADERVIRSVVGAV